MSRGREECWKKSIGVKETLRVPESQERAARVFRRKGKTAETSARTTVLGRREERERERERQK